MKHRSRATRYSRAEPAPGFDDIRVGVSEPEDFDKFWNDTIKNELDTVSPVVLEKKEFSSGDPGDVVYDIKVACAGKYPVSGYLRRRETRARESCRL